MTPKPNASLIPVTVIIAAYNAESFLRRAVASALGQSAPILEVLIVDDASTDGTIAVAEELATADARVRLLTLPKNSGPSMARNVGLVAAKGQWVAVLDADDAYLPERLERMLEAAVEGEADIVVDNFRYYDVSTGIVGAAVLEERPEFEVLTLEHFLNKARPLTDEPDWGLLKPIFRRSFIENSGLRYPTYSRHGEDFLLMVEALVQGARCVLSRWAGYLYTTRDSGYSRTTINYSLMVRHTEALMGDPRIAVKPVLVESLRERAAALTKYSAARDLSRFRRERDYVSLACRLLLDKAFRSMLREKVVRKFRVAH